MQLNNREKIAVSIAGLALVLFLFFQVVFFPLIDKRKKTTRAVATKKTALVEMKEMKIRYQQLSVENSGLAEVLSQREQGFSLFSFLEKGAAESQVKKDIAYMKPSVVTGNDLLKQSMVEMKLQAVGLKELIAFLQQVESPESLVALKRISIQENTKEGSSLDVILQVISVDNVVNSDG